MTLETLLIRAHVSNWDQSTWFSDCRLEAHVLLVPDRATGATIGRCFGPDVRAVLPDLVIRVARAPSATPATHRRIWNQRTAAPTQDRLLD